MDNIPWLHTDSVTSLLSPPQLQIEFLSKFFFVHNSEVENIKNLYFFHFQLEKSV